MYSLIFTMISICVKHFGNKHNHCLSVVMVYNMQIYRYLYIYICDTKLYVKNFLTLK